jgi:cell wall-associated NlpC family hydrolase
MFRKRLVLTHVLLAAAVAAGAGVAVDASASAADCGVLSPGAAPEAEAAVVQACGLLGTPYSWGGGHVDHAPGPSYGQCDAAHGAPNDCHVFGFDCSGMVRYAYYLAVGEDVINGTTRSQWQTSRAVDRFSKAEGYDPLLPGDLLFYGPNAEGIHHVAMYLGNRMIVEAPFSGSVVRVVSVTTHNDYFGSLRLYAGGGVHHEPGWDRVAYTEGDQLYVKEGDLDAAPVLQDADVAKFQLEGDRVGVLTTDGALLVKEGDLGPGWQEVDADSVTDFQMDGDRIAFTEGDQLYVKEGDLAAEPVDQDVNVVKFQLEGDRIGVLTDTGALLVKAGDLGPGWETIDEDSVTAFQLEGTRIGYSEGGDVYVREDELDAESVPQETGVSSFQLSGDRIGVLKDGALLVKEGDLEPGWEVVDEDSVTGFQLSGDRIAFAEGSTLYAREGGLDAETVEQDDTVDRFQLSGDRIAVLSGDSLYAKEGDLGPGWLDIDADSVTDFQIGAHRDDPTSA